MNILLLYPKFPATFWSFQHALRFIDKKAANPPLGLVTVAAMLPETWNARLIDLNVEPVSDDQIVWADLVLVSAMTVQRKSVNEIIQLCHKLETPIAAGGPLFSCEPDEFPEVDYLILNEGEITFKEFLADFASGHAKRVYDTQVYPEMSISPIPRFELLNMDAYDTLSVQFSRGCPYHCDFCNVTALFGHKPRLKSTRQFISELDALYKAGWRRKIFIVDDNFIGNKRLLKEEVLPALIEWRRDKVGFQFITEASINLADDDELIDLMVQAGFNSIFISIETPSAEGLDECHKTQNTRRDLLRNVHKLQEAGLQVMAGFIVGFDSDTEDIFQRQYDFIQESGIVTAMVGLLQAPAGTELYARLKAEGRIREGFSGDNGDGETNIIPKMDSSILRKGYVDLVRQLFEPASVYQRIDTLLQHHHPQKAPVRLTWTEMKAFFRTMIWIGVQSDARWYYWRLFIKIVFTHPARLPLAITMTVYAYHFNKMSREHVRLTEALPEKPHRPIMGRKYSYEPTHVK